MRRRKLIPFPTLVRLPTQPRIRSGELQKVFGISRAVLWIWRNRDGFPAPAAPFRQLGFVRTADVAAWAIARGVRVEWL